MEEGFLLCCCLVFLVLCGLLPLEILLFYIVKKTLEGPNIAICLNIKTAGEQLHTLPNYLNTENTTASGLNRSQLNEQSRQPSHYFSIKGRIRIKRTAGHTLASIS